MSCSGMLSSGQGHLWVVCWGFLGKSFSLLTVRTGKALKSSFLCALLYLSVMTVNVRGASLRAKAMLRMTEGKEGKVCSSSLLCLSQLTFLLLEPSLPLDFLLMEDNKFYYCENPGFKNFRLPLSPLEGLCKRRLLVPTPSF